jgi:hypothetical protein
LAITSKFNLSGPRSLKSELPHEYIQESKRNVVENVVRISKITEIWIKTKETTEEIYRIMNIMNFFNDREVMHKNPLRM